MFFIVTDNNFFEPVAVKISNNAIFLMNDIVATEHYQGNFTSRFIY